MGLAGVGEACAGAGVGGACASTAGGIAAKLISRRGRLPVMWNAPSSDVMYQEETWNRILVTLPTRTYEVAIPKVPENSSYTVEQNQDCSTFFVPSDEEKTRFQAQQTFLELLR